MVFTQRSLSSPNNGCEEDYDFIGLTRTQLTKNLIFSSRRRQKMGSGSQGAIVHTVQPRKMLCQFLNTTQHSLPVDPPFGCVFLCVQQLLLLFNTFAVSSFQPAQQHQACDTPLSPWEIDNTTGVYVYSSFRRAKCFIYLSFQLISKDGENKAKDLTSPAFLLPSVRVSPFLAGSVFHTCTRNSLVLPLLRKMRDNSLSEAPSKLMRFRLKPQRFWYVLAYHPHYTD